LILSWEILVHRALYWFLISCCLSVALFAEEPTAQMARVKKLSSAELSALQERGLRGDAEAQVLLGLAHDGGNRAYKQDTAEARRWYEMAAKQGNIDARFWLVGLDYTTGKKPSLSRAEYLALAQAGHLGGMNVYANFCAQGEGGPKDLAAAMQWWKKTAEAGSAEGAFNLGIMFLDGEGVPVNKTEAVAWLRRAANKDYLPAIKTLSPMALMGESGLKPGPETTHWLQVGANSGDPVAMNNLGMAYAHAMGVDTDYVEAYKWFALVHEKGMGDARPGIRSKMKPEQVAEGEKRAREWIASHMED
jgi:uncharacterized protein